MAQIQTSQCDICKVMKKDVNHWWKGYIGIDCGDPQALFILPHTSSITSAVNKRPPADLCGFDCVTKWLHQQMQEIINRENANRTASTDKKEV